MDPALGRGGISGAAITYSLSSRLPWDIGRILGIFRLSWAPQAASIAARVAESGADGTRVHRSVPRQFAPPSLFAVFPRGSDAVLSGAPDRGRDRDRGVP